VVTGHRRGACRNGEADDQQDNKNYASGGHAGIFPLACSKGIVMVRAGKRNLITDLPYSHRQRRRPQRCAAARIGMIAADCLSRAIARGVYEAETLGAIKSYKERFGAGW
jgi:hypothetical protein